MYVAVPLFHPDIIGRTSTTSQQDTTHRAGSAGPDVLLHCPARTVRCRRGSLGILLGFLVGWFVLINVLLLIIVWTNPGGTAWPGYSTNMSKVTLGLSRQSAERTGFCDKVHLDGDVSAYNQTVLGICKDIRRDELKYYRRHGRRVNPFGYKFLLDGRGLCTEHTDVVVLVHSLHNYEERRQGIRTTWGNAVKNKSWPGRSTIRANVSVGFVLGYHKTHSWNVKAYKENRKYNDLIMGDFIDDYKNMTLKSLLGLKWVTQRCPRVKYLIKSDDDMIINFPYLFDVLDSTDMRRAIMGPYNGGSRVLRKGKWKMAQKDFPFYYYPPYESGACYVISGDLVKDLYQTSEYVPWIFIDDVYITGIVGKIVGVRHLRRDGFAFWNSPKPKLCDLVENKVLTGTKMKTNYLKALWKDLEGNHTCSVPTASGSTIR